MISTDLVSTILAAFLFAGTVLAQNPIKSSPISTEREVHLVTPEDVLSIRELRELQLSPDGKQEYAHQLDVQKRVVAWFDKHLKP